MRWAGAGSAPGRGARRRGAERAPGQHLPCPRRQLGVADAAAGVAAERREVEEDVAPVAALQRRLADGGGDLLHDGGTVVVVAVTIDDEALEPDGDEIGQPLLGGASLEGEGVLGMPPRDEPEAPRQLRLEDEGARLVVGGRA